MPEEILETPQPAQLTESKSTDWTKIVLIAVLGLGLLAGSAYAGYYYGTQQVSQPKADRPLDETPVVSQPTPIPTPTTPIEDQTNKYTDVIDLETPVPGSSVSSPIVVKGRIDSSWMFEGIFLVRLLDADRKELAKTNAVEVTPGSWTSGEMVEFAAELDFTTEALSGYLVLVKSNPSGLPENDDFFESPINFVP